ncbi:MAG: hypothetical protein HC905_31730 [Bacteroidales bacterium]|nr:hypothetical protein [Bacteroidales bacterium]
MVSSGKIYELKIPKDFEVIDNSLFWIMTPKKWVSFNNERHFLKLFPEKNEALKQFIKANKIRFKEVDDMIKLVKYLNEI